MAHKSFLDLPAPHHAPTNEFQNKKIIMFIVIKIF